MNGMNDPQLHFDTLVAVAIAYFGAPAFSPAERALEAQIEEAKRRDEGVASAAVSLAFRRVAPPGLEWR
jgi:hypothetical protein